MSDFSVYTLASGSKGNCVYIRIGDDEILIDAGISCRRISDSLKELGTDLSRIKAIFITHEHSDHIGGLESICKKYGTPVHFTEPSANLHFIKCGTVHTQSAAVIHPILYSEEIGSLSVRSFAASHDSAACVGFTVGITGEAPAVAVATDMGTVTEGVKEALRGIENVILESNHDENMLLCGPYPYDLKRRILSSRGHLSNEAAAEFAAELAGGGTKRILLAHLSRENNLPELAYHSALAAIGERKDIFLNVAAPDTPTRLV